MRELEFLPDWYPRLRRRKRTMVIQLWGTFALVAALGLWAAAETQRIGASQRMLAGLTDNVNMTQMQVKQLTELLDLERQQQKQLAVLEKLGLHVEAARLIKRLEESMPAEMALCSLGYQVEEQPRPAAGVAPGSADSVGVAERRLRVKLQGLAPTDVDVADFLTKLGNVPYFQQVAMSYAKDRSDGGHLMREFEVSFGVPLGLSESRP